MEMDTDFPQDFHDCVHFHGHLCPGLAIGYGAVKAAQHELGLTAAKDEEVVAIVENDSCAVDAIQVLLGCTFGKGNLIFRDWGKQVFTFFDRPAGRGVRVSLRQKPLPGSEERRTLRKRINSGDATEQEKGRWDELRKQAVMDLISADYRTYYEVRVTGEGIPPEASIVETRPCAQCGEATVITKMVKEGARLLCRGCTTAGV